MTEKLKKQIETIRETGKVNMLDCNGVQCLADEMDFYQLVVYIEEHRQDYWRYIMGG